MHFIVRVTNLGDKYVFSLMVITLGDKYAFCRTGNKCAFFHKVYYFG